MKKVRLIKLIWEELLYVLGCIWNTLASRYPQVQIKSIKDKQEERMQKDMQKQQENYMKRKTKSILHGKNSGNNRSLSPFQKKCVCAYFSHEQG